jgi:alpha-ketoglutarate-dependent taurine dioxygenase
MTVAQRTGLFHEQIKLSHEPIRPKIGSRILNSKDELLSGVLAAKLRELLEQCGVLVFPEIHFTDEEQIAFTKTLGQFTPEMRGEEIYKITLDTRQNARADYLKGSLYWHIDGTMHEYPIRASLLSSKKLATWGGNTEFCNTYAAWEDLPEDRKVGLEQYRVMHSAWTSLFYYDPEPSQAKLEEMMAIGERELPLVWKHRSGRKSLVLGCTAHHVVDMNWTRSAALLNGLRDWATGEAFHYAHEWKVGDTVMWDNTGTMHRARPYDPDCGRMLHRTILAGEEPVN